MPDALLQSCTADDGGDAGGDTHPLGLQALCLGLIATLQSVDSSRRGASTRMGADMRQAYYDFFEQRLEWEG